MSQRIASLAKNQHAVRAKENQERANLAERRLNDIELQVGRQEQMVDVIAFTRGIRNADLQIDFIHTPNKASLFYENETGEGLREILDDLARIPGIEFDVIELKNVQLSGLDLKKVASLKPEKVVLERNGIRDGGGLDEFAYDQLRNITISHQHITNLFWAESIPSLQWLELRAVPLDNSCLELNFAFARTLGWLQVDGFELKDSHLEDCLQFTNLKMLWASQSCFSVGKTLKFCTGLPECNLVGTVGEIDPSTNEGAELAAIMNNSSKPPFNKDRRRVMLDVAGDPPASVRTWKQARIE